MLSLSVQFTCFGIAYGLIKYQEAMHRIEMDKLDKDWQVMVDELNKTL